MPVLGFAAVNVHNNVTVSPSLTLYGFSSVGLTSGLSVSSILKVSTFVEFFYHTSKSMFV